jgi:arginase family enzyme
VAAHAILHAVPVLVSLAHRIIVEIETVLRIALSQSTACGMEVTILNPTLDADGNILRNFVDMLTRSFAATAYV